MDIKSFDGLFARLEDLKECAGRGNVGVSAFFSPREVLAATELSVGKGIYFSKLYVSEINTLWAWTLTSVIVSLILEFIVKKTLRLIERRGI